MGAHKYNPTAIAAKEGKLPPKPPKKSKRETERELYGAVMAAMIEKVPETAALLAALSDAPYRR